MPDERNLPISRSRHKDEREYSAGRRVEAGRRLEYARTSSGSRGGAHSVSGENESSEALAPNAVGVFGGRLLNSPQEIFAHLGAEWKELVFLTIPIVSLAIFLQIYTGKLTTALTIGGPVYDAILYRIPALDLSFFFVWGYIAMISVFGLHAIFVDIKSFRRAAFLFSMIVIVRAGFILLTGLRSPEGSLPVLFPGFTGKLQAENDLFFSGHTAIPFMAFLVNKNRKFLRLFFLAGSISLGASALIMHRHYSIDVFAAPFITYGVYVLGSKLYVVLRRYLRPKTSIDAEGDEALE